MPHAELPGRRLFFERAGEGEPLLLVQGMSGTHLSWGEPFPRALRAGGLETIAYDHRGVGHSDRVEPHQLFSIAELADDAAALLDVLEIESAHALGVSMGGMVAQELALRHPESVRTLTLGCTFTGGAHAVMPDAAVGLALAEALRFGDRERALRRLWELNVSPAFAAEPGAYETFGGLAAALPVSVRMIFMQLGAIGGHDTGSRLGAIAAPTLVLHGTDDRMIPVANAEILTRLIPGARLALLEGVGHGFWWEQPERAARLVLDHARVPTNQEARP
jgi:pimeloyl-ACP methyl ester carboxylesterase